MVPVPNAESQYYLPKSSPDRRIVLSVLGIPPSPVFMLFILHLSIVLMRLLVCSRSEARP